MVWEEIEPLCPFFAEATRGLETTWAEHQEMKTEDVEVDTNPLLLLASPELRSAEPLETVVHLKLNVQTGRLSEAVSLCYPPPVLRSLLPYLN